MTDLQTSAAVDTVHAFAAHGATLYAARTSGLHATDDGGATWRSLYSALDVSPATYALAVAPDGRLFAGVRGGLLISPDAGRSWRLVALPEPAPLVSALAVAPTQDGALVLAATLDDGIFRSDDGGTSWAAWNFGLLDTRVLCLAVSPAFTADQTVIVGTEEGAFRSANSGRSWHDLRFDAAPVQHVAFGPDARTIYAATEAGGLYVSRDGGDTWARLAASTLTDAVNTVHVLPSGGLLVATPDALWRSDDGDDWRTVADDGPTALLPLDDRRVLTAHPDGTISIFEV